MKVFQLIKKISEPVKIVVEVKTLDLPTLFSRAIQGDERYVPVVVGTDVISGTSVPIGVGLGLE